MKRTPPLLLAVEAADVPVDAEGFLRRYVELLLDEFLVEGGNADDDQPYYPDDGPKDGQGSDPTRRTHTGLPARQHRRSIGRDSRHS